MSQVQSILKNAISSGTRRNYQQYEEVWSNFLSDRFAGVDTLLCNQTEKGKRGILVLFVQHLSSSNMGVRSGMAALRNMFRIGLEDTKIFDDASVLAARDSCRPDPRTVSLAKETRLRLPVPFELVKVLRMSLWLDDSGNLDRKMTYLGIMLAYCLCLRVGEYAHDSDSRGKHSIRNEDVYLLCKDLVQRRPWEFSEHSKYEVVSVLLILRSSKVDNTGRGRYEYIYPDSELHVEFLGDLIWWVRNSSSKPEEPFLSRYQDVRGKLSYKVLTREMITTALKEGATSIGLDSTRISSHSLKIGGPSDMRAAGFGDEAISRKSKHASDASLGYQMSSKRDVGPLTVASQGLGLSVKEVANLLPLKRRVINGDPKKLILKLKRPLLESAVISDNTLNSDGGLTCSSSGKGILNSSEYK